MTHPLLSPNAEVARAIAPTGTLRAAINLGNGVLAQRSPSGGLQGASVRLAQEVARKLGLSLELVPFRAAGGVVQAIGQDAWDVAFLAVDPVRAEQICFTRPYVLIESTYLVREDSPLHAVADVDSPGVRVAASQGSAYELYLRRTLRQAQLVSLPTTEESFAAFRDQALDALAGVRPALARLGGRLPGLRLLRESFLTVQHAMALPRRGATALPFLDAFLAQALASGFVQRALAETGQVQAAVVPAV